MSAITATVQLRRDTAANWTANNPTLLAGEVGIETDTRRMKFGNGTQAWTALAYAQGTAAQSNTGDFDAAGSAAAAQAAAIAASQPLDADLTSYANAADAAARRALIGAGTGNGNMVAANNLSDLASAATARTNLGLGTAAQVNTGTGASDVPTITQADARYTQLGGSPDSSPFLSVTNGTIVAWSNMPAALTFFLGQSRWVLPMDLTNRTQIQLQVLTSGITGVAGSKLRLLYRLQSGGFSSTITDYVTVGSSEVEAAIDTATTFTTSGWINIVAGAKNQVLLALAGISGDGAADPNFIAVWVQAR